MSFSRPIQWYNSHVDPNWPDGTFKNLAAFPSIFQTKYLDNVCQVPAELIV